MIISLKNVEKRVGAETHIYPTSIELTGGGFNVLLGATGAGKTTLIKLLAGLEAPTAGEVWFGDRNVTKLSPQRRNISLVHQFFVNYPHFTVYENIASPLRIAKVPADELDRRVREAADLLRLGPMLSRRPSELSGGQQQRTALARAIIKDADLVLLDEPLANLDYKLREELRDELPRIFADRGAVVVYATSEPSEALLLGGRTAAMIEGRVAQIGPTSDVYRQPRDLWTAMIFSDPPINVAPVEKQGGEIRLGRGVSWPADGAIAAARDGRYTVGVRPGYVTPTAEGGGAVTVEGVVLVTELSGSESVAHFTMDAETSNETIAPWVSLSHGVHAFEVGERRLFYLDPRRCLYFDDDGQRVVG